jgi:F-type H+-transporting ATPase subunit delta
MKISKIATSTARRIFRLCQSGGRLDEAKLSGAIRDLARSKPRGHVAVLMALKRLVRLEMERRRVIIESAADLDQASRDRIVSGIAIKYGADLSFEFRTNPALLGGLKIRVGNDVFDGSVQGRLDRLANAF